MGRPCTSPSRPYVPTSRMEERHVRVVRARVVGVADRHTVRPDGKLVPLGRDAFYLLHLRRLLRPVLAARHAHLARRRDERRRLGNGGRRLFSNWTLRAHEQPGGNKYNAADRSCFAFHGLPLRVVHRDNEPPLRLDPLEPRQFPISMLQYHSPCLGILFQDEVIIP